MGSKSKSTTNASFQNQQQPYAPTIGPLGTLIGNIGQSQGNLPDYAPQAQSLAGGLLSNLPNFNQFAADTYSGYQKQLTPFTQQSYLDPMSNPYLGPALETLSGDITNGIKSQFAAAGRTGSGLETQNLARGLSQGLAPLLLGQYNTNVGTYTGASKDLFNAGNSTNQGVLGNAMTGLQVGQQVPLLANNAGAIESLLVPLAGLGQQNQGTSQQTTVNTPSALQTAMGWGSLIGKGLGLAFPTSPYGAFMKV